MARFLVVTLIPSPYQVELFNRLAEAGADLQVAYVQRSLKDRHWATPQLKHAAFFLEAKERKPLERAAATADLTIISNYSHPAARELMRRREADGRVWCFWGERPGFRRLGFLGRAFRRVRLATLHASGAPIWGMGEWAVEGWRREFGARRAYHNIPYFSDLERFRPIGPRRRGRRRRILFSGSLIPRKGIDLVLSAFLRLAAREAHLDLDVLGAGPLEAELKMKAKNQEGRIRFLGFRDWPDLPSAYREADLHCVPSRYDGWGLVVPEGLAAGLPTIASDRMGAALELIQPGANGWLVRAGDDQSLYEALAEAAQLSEAELERRSEAAQMVASRHSLELGVRRWLAAAESALSKGSQQGSGN